MDTAGMREGLVTKGVLVDMARLKGVPYLEPGTKLYVEDIEAWEEQAGVSIGSGDALLLRTGRWARRAEFGAGEPMSGWDASVMPWMAERDIALLGADSVHEAPDTVPGLGFNPIHRFAIVSRGMNLLDNLDLEAAAETAARLNQWDFMLVIAPLRVPGRHGLAGEPAGDLLINGAAPQTPAGHSRAPSPHSVGITYLGLRPKPPPATRGAPSPHSVGITYLGPAPQTPAGHSRGPFAPLRGRRAALCAAWGGSPPGRISGRSRSRRKYCSGRDVKPISETSVYSCRVWTAMSLPSTVSRSKNRGAVERSGAEHLQKVQVVAGQPGDDVRRAERPDHLGRRLLRVDGLEAERQLRGVDLRLRRTLGPRPGRHQREVAVEAGHIRQPTALRANALDREAARQHQATAIPAATCLARVGDIRPPQALILYTRIPAGCQV